MVDHNSVIPLSYFMPLLPQSVYKITQTYPCFFFNTQIQQGMVWKKNPQVLPALQYDQPVLLCLSLYSQGVILIFRNMPIAAVAPLPSFFFRILHVKNIFTLQIPFLIQRSLPPPCNEGHKEFFVYNQCFILCSRGRVYIFFKFCLILKMVQNYTYQKRT